MRHPYAHTLALLKMAIDTLPPGFPEGRKEYFRHLHNTLVIQGEKASYDELQRAIVALGRESWPHRSAYDEMYARYGRASEESHLLERLDKVLREKYERFIHEGGKIAHVATAKTIEALRDPGPFERFFTPEEKFAIGQALVDARVAARREIDGLVSGRRAPKADEYHDLTHARAAEQRKVVAKLEELRRMADMSDKWKEDIMARVRAFEEGWSILEPAATPIDLDQEIDYWKGTLASFLHA